MSLTHVAAMVFAGVAALAIAFQLALAGGAPWGELAMGGRFPGRLPPRMRIAAVVQAGILAAFVLIVLARARLLVDPWSASGVVWVVVAFSCVSLLLNLITPSPRERRIWAPVALVMFVASLTVAMGS